MGRLDAGVPWANDLAECIVVAIVCAAPWMLGSIQARESAHAAGGDRSRGHPRGDFGPGG